MERKQEQRFIPRVSRRWLIPFSIGAGLLFIVSSYFFFLNPQEVNSGAGVKDIFYVDGSLGSDTNNCTATSTACKTIQAAVNKITAGDGDEVKIRGTDDVGNSINYGNISAINRDISGAQGSPTRFSFYGGSPTLTASPSSLSDPWLKLSDGPLGARAFHSAIWTGTEMIIWGGNAGSYFSDGARYNPETNQWSALLATSPLSPRAYHTAIWTGTEMIIWGGWNGASYFSDGARWRPNGTGGCTNLNGCWSSLTPSPLSQRSNHTVVWTGTEMIIWGGWNGTSYFSDGARWRPDGVSGCVSPDGCWTYIDPAADVDTLSPRINHTAVWTGTEMIVWGGGSPLTFANGARYSPGSGWIPLSASPLEDRKYHSAVWTGKEMIIVNGVQDRGTSPTNFDNFFKNGARWFPSGVDGCIDTNGCWSLIANHLAGGSHRSAVWTGSQMITLGGGIFQKDGSYILASGSDPYAYSISTNSWSSVLSLPINSPRYGHSAISTGTQMIVWGGVKFGGGYFSDGALYNFFLPWGMLPSSPLQGRRKHTAVWTGSEMVIAGGYFSSDGARYDPSDPVNPWKMLPLQLGFEYPSRRGFHTAVWTGTEMIVWGGWNGSYLNDGYAWRPKDVNGCASTNGCWRKIAATSLAVRSFHTAVWTGTEMIVWGGSGPGASSDGARYNPSLDQWFPLASSPLGARSRHTAVWTGTEMVIWGGDNETTDFSNGASWRPNGVEGCANTDGCWRALSGTSLAGRHYHTAVWTGTEMIVWGGERGTSPNVIYYNDGSRWRPNGVNGCINSGGCWQVMAAPPAMIDVRSQHTAVWTGTEMIIWGGFGGASYANNGAKYRSQTDTWAMLPDSPLGGRSGHTAVLDTSISSSICANEFRMIVWGGFNSVDRYLNDGAIYSEVLDPQTTQPLIYIFTNTPVRNISFDGLTLKKSLDETVHIESTLNSVENITISNSRVEESCKDGIVFQSPSVVQSISLSGNTITLSQGPGIKFIGQTITGNLIDSNTISSGKSIAIYLTPPVSENITISNNVISGNTVSTNLSDAIHLHSNAGSITSNSILRNTIKQNSGDAIELLSTGTVSSNTISSNLIAQNSFYGLWFNGGTSATLSSNKVFQNTIDANTLGNISLQGSAALSSGNALRNNITTNTASVAGILTNILDSVKLNSNFNYIWNALNPQTTEGSGSICPSGCASTPLGNPYVITTLTDPYAYYLSSQAPATAADLRRIALGSGAGPGPDKVLGTVDDVRLDARNHDNTADLAIGAQKFGAINMGARDELAINENGSNTCSTGVCVLSNSLQQSHDHSSLTLGDHVNVYTVYDSAGARDRTYAEALSTSAAAPITFTKRGLPGYPITWHNMSYSVSSSQWYPDTANPSFLAAIDARSFFPSNLEVKADATNNNKFRCTDLKGFLFQNATSTPVTGDVSKMTVPSSNTYHWACTPYKKTTLESRVFYTGYATGVAYNTITWFGEKPFGSNRYIVELRLATSNCSNGAGNPPTCNSGSWNDGSTNPGNDYLAQESGFNTCNYLYTYTSPQPGEPIPIKCYRENTNKRYFRYQLTLNYYDKNSNSIPDDGEGAPRVDEVRVNYSP